MNIPDSPAGATFSDCRKYRFLLWRIWDRNKPLVQFIGLNPSKANETRTDNTITRVASMAREQGYGGFYMTNLFAYISTDPDELETSGEPLDENNAWLQLAASTSARIIFAWGAFPMAKQRAAEVAAMFPDGMALVINKDGSPRHPLYVPGGTVPIPFTTKTSV